MGPDGNKTWVVEAGTRFVESSGDAADDVCSPPLLYARGNRFFRGYPDLLEIESRVMNPTDKCLSAVIFNLTTTTTTNTQTMTDAAVKVGATSSACNKSPLASSLVCSARQIRPYTPIRRVYSNAYFGAGGINKNNNVSISPTLPAHYINAFAPAASAKRHPAVGQTALVHGSQLLEVTAQYDLDEQKQEESSPRDGGGGDDDDIRKRKKKDAGKTIWSDSRWELETSCCSISGYSILDCPIPKIDHNDEGDKNDVDCTENLVVVVPAPFLSRQRWRGETDTVFTRS